MSRCALQSSFRRNPTLPCGGLSPASRLCCLCQARPIACWTPGITYSTSWIILRNECHIYSLFRFMAREACPDWWGGSYSAHLNPTSTDVLLMHLGN
ncbi:hypothetical protein BDW66DRAFT_143431 [Aspergillus desertorum]